MRHALLLALALCLAASTLAQVPGTIQYPTAQDTAATLFEAADNAATVLTLSINSSDTTANVTSTTKFGSSGSLVIDNEIIFYTGKTGTSFTGLLRGRSGTSAASHASGTAVRAPILAAHHNAQSAAILALEAKLGFTVSAPAVGQFLKGAGAGSSAWGALASGDIPSLDASKVTTGTFGASQIPSLDASKVTTGTLPNARTTATTAATANTIVERDSGGAVNASGIMVNDTLVVGAQGDAIADPDESVASNTEAIKALLAHFRGWGSLSTLYRSTLNDGLVSLWLMNSVNDAAGSNHLTNTGGVTFNAAGANFSGSNHLSVANNSSFQIDYRQSFTLVADARLDTKATTQAIYSKTDGVSANEFSLVYASAADGIDRFRFNVYPGGTTQVGVNASSAGSPATATDYFIVARYDAWAHQICIQVNNGAADCASATLTSHPYTAQFAVGSLSVPGPSLRLDGSVRVVGLWSRELSAEEGAELYGNRAALAYPLKAATTARLEHVVQPYHLFDNRAEAHAAAEAGYGYALPYSRAGYSTTATSMVVEEYSNNGEVDARGRKLNVRVNGANYTLITAPQAGGVTQHTVPLPVGNKVVEVWNGFQFLSGSDLLGTWVRSVTFNAPAQVRAPGNKGPHLVAQVDSIGAGAGANTPTLDGWIMQLRDIYPGSVAVEGWGGRQFYHCASDSVARALCVQQVITQNPDAFLGTLGTNDYFAASWTAAAFGTAYAAFLDDLHAARPGMPVYLLSPIPRTTETANGVGSTLGNYRTQVQTVCAARSYCTFIDGSAVTGFNTGTDLFDVVHPNSSGHGKIFNYVRMFFGL